MEAAAPTRTARRASMGMRNAGATIIYMRMSTRTKVGGTPATVRRVKQAL